jgi:hypothetical protein
VGDDNIIGLNNWRLPGLFNNWEDKKLRTLKEMIIARDFYGKRATINYAQSRYFTMYIQKLGLLTKFYKKLKKEYKNNGTDDIKIIESVLDDNINTINEFYLHFMVSSANQ